MWFCSSFTRFDLIIKRNDVCTVAHQQHFTRYSAHNRQCSAISTVFVEYVESIAHINTKYIRWQMALTSISLCPWLCVYISMCHAVVLNKTVLIKSKVVLCLIFFFFIWLVIYLFFFFFSKSYFGHCVVYFYLATKWTKCTECCDWNYVFKRVFCFDDACDDKTTLHRISHHFMDLISIHAAAHLKTMEMW